MKNLYLKTEYNAIIQRLNLLTEKSSPKWGKMNISQMIAHLTEVQEIANGRQQLKGTPWFIKLFKGVVRKMILSEKPYSKNAKTHPQYIITTTKNFEEEKTKILNALDYFYNEKPNIKHPILGNTTETERGWATYKHLDYHLKQFGV